MANEITQLHDYLGVDFAPANIEFLYKDDLLAFTEKLAKKYDGLLYTADNLKELRDDKSQLLAVAKQLDERRKEIKRAYNQPLKAYEADVKEVLEPLDKVLTDIRETEKRIETKQKELREDILKDYISQQTELDIEIDPKWLNKGAFTSKDELKKDTKDRIQEAIQAKESEVAQQEADKQAVTKYAEAKGLEAGGYVDLLAYQPLAEVMAKIDHQASENEPEATSDQDEAKHQEPKKKPSEGNILPWDEAPEEPQPKKTKTVTISGPADKVMTIVNQALDLGLEVSHKPTLYISDEIEYTTDDLPW